MSSKWVSFVWSSENGRAPQGTRRIWRFWRVLSSNSIIHCSSLHFLHISMLAFSQILVIIIATYPLTAYSFVLAVAYLSAAYFFDLHFCFWVVLILAAAYLRTVCFFVFYFYFWLIVTVADGIILIKTQNHKEKKNENNKQPVKKLTIMQIFRSRPPLGRPQCRINWSNIKKTLKQSTKLKYDDPFSVTVKG